MSLIVSLVPQVTWLKRMTFFHGLSTPSTPSYRAEKVGDDPQQNVPCLWFDFVTVSCFPN